MATEKHKYLANIIKDCHESLRQLSKIHGPERAWEEHLKNTKMLEEYAQAMNDLSCIWEENTENDDLLARSRIKWTIDYCMKYFYTEGILLNRRQRELRLLESWEGYDTSLCMLLDHHSGEPIKMLDVGSCFNPFLATKLFQVTAIDIHPANDSVHRCDFLKVDVREMQQPEILFKDNAICSLPANYFECVIFSLLLEYIPSSAQRLTCCRKAFDLLKFEGILIVITPDSQHVGKNAKLMKNWRYSLATLGFIRILFEKLPHITCMVFRKATDARVAQRWAELHREDYMTLSVDIPQDNK